jgi:hypothetical protein
MMEADTAETRTRHLTEWRERKDQAQSRQEARMITDDEMHVMPWTHDLMTLEEFEQWVASRPEAGRAIDIETCELGRWAALELDPYGIREARGEEPYPQVGTNRFVRSPESRGWVWEGDLPTEKAKAMYDRIYRDYEAFQALEKKFEHAATTTKLRDENNESSCAPRRSLVSVQMFKLPSDVDEQCRLFGLRTRAHYARAGSPYSRAVSSHGMHDNSEGLADAKRGECIFALHMNLDPLIIVNWSVERPDTGCDFIIDGFRINVKRTSFAGDRLIWPPNKWRFFDDEQFDLLVLTKTRLADDGCGEGYAAGWCDKQIFRRRHAIADGSETRRHGEGGGGSGMAS